MYQYLSALTYMPVANIAELFKQLVVSVHMDDIHLDCNMTELGDNNMEVKIFTFQVSRYSLLLPFCFRRQEVRNSWLRMATLSVMNQQQKDLQVINPRRRKRRKKLGEDIFSMAAPKSKWSDSTGGML